MRILLVTEDLPVPNLGGAGRHAVLLGNALIAAGHAVEMLGRVRAPGVEGSNDFQGPLHCGIDLAGTGWQEYRFGAYLPRRREHVARRIWQAIRCLAPERFDVVHYHGHHYALGAQVPAGLPFVQTVHDQGAECLRLTRFKQGAPCAETEPEACAGCATSQPGRLQRALSAAAVRRHRAASAEAFARHPVVFVSEFLHQRYLAHARPARPLRAFVLHNFTDLSRMQGLPERPSVNTDGRPLALMVGRIDPTKGFGALLDLIPNDMLARWRIRVVGDGPQLAELKERHAPRGVDFAGLLDQHSVYLETMAANVCIVPSIWEEPFGATTLEGLTMGRPVVALSRGGTPELVRYEQYPGQLVLLPDLNAMVAWLARGVVPPPVGLTRDPSVDVTGRLPALLEVYAAARRNAEV